jgi:hypothetical protein
MNHEFYKHADAHQNAGPVKFEKLKAKAETALEVGYPIQQVTMPFAKPLSLSPSPKIDESIKRSKSSRQCLIPKETSY